MKPIQLIVLGIALVAAIGLALMARSMMTAKPPEHANGEKVIIQRGDKQYKILASTNSGITTTGLIDANSADLVIELMVSNSLNDLKGRITKASIPK